MSKPDIRYAAVEIVDNDTGKVEHTVKLDPPRGLRMAERTEDGMNINLNHDRFYTRLVED